MVMNEDLVAGVNKKPHHIEGGGGGAAYCYAMCKIWSEVTLNLNTWIVYIICLLGAYTSNLHTLTSSVTPCT